MTEEDKKFEKSIKRYQLLTDIIDGLLCATFMVVLAAILLFI